ncbi:MAG: GTPase ObgE [Calditrichota bacterium]
MFIDWAKIYVKAGQGGSGACSFRREKHVDKGGPNGGDGGRGGNIILKVDPHLNTLIDFKYKKRFVARHGQHGMGSNRQGRNADDISIRIPAGTVVKDAENESILADLVKPGKEFVIARGGKGGRGNARFATPTHQAPREWEIGEPGEERWLILELKLLADVGLVGKPNAGKSTLLSRVSAARPKIADYPFTTLQPNLGIVKVDDSKSFLMADIPGLIEGAHQGKGLGLERTKLLVYLIDPSEEDPKTVFKVLAGELREYSSRLTEKPFIIVFSKKDVWQEDYLKKYKKKFDAELIGISSISGDGLAQLNRTIRIMLENLDKENELNQVESND